jgi:hypothetical protein
VQKLKVWSHHLNFLFKNAENYSGSKSLLPVLHKIELGKHPTRNFYEFELIEEDYEIISDFLINLIGVKEDGEIDAAGRVADELIDIFNIYSE